MSRLGPTTRSFFAPIALGIGVAAGGRALIQAVGPSPVHLIGVVASTALSLLAAHQSSSPQVRNFWKTGFLIIPWCFLLGLDTILSAWGDLARHGALDLELGLLLLWAGWVIALLPWTWLYRSRGRPDASWCAPLMATGATLGFGMDLIPAMLICTGLFAVLALFTTPVLERPGGLRWRLGRIPALALTVSASASLWLALRASMDPTLSGSAVFGAMVLLALPVGRSLAPRNSFNALLMGAAWSLLSIALLRLLGRWTREFLRLSTEGTSLIDGAWAIWSSPALLGLVCGFIIGMAIGPPRSGLPPRGRAAGVFIGLALLPWTQHEGTLGVIAGIAGGCCFLLATRRSSQAFGLILAISASMAPTLIPQYPVGEFGVDPAERPNAWMVDLSQGQFRLLQRTEDLKRDGAWRIDRIPAAMQWGLHGTGSAWAQTSAWDEQSSDTRDPSLVVEQEGLLSWTRGREAKAEYLGGLLGASLVPNARHSLILGDPTGRALMGLKAARPEGAMGSVVIAVPQKGPLAQVEIFDSGLSDALTPFDTIVHAHPEYVLRVQSEVDLLVEVIRAPWQDGTGLALTPDHIEAVASRLDEQGVFVSVVHLRWFDQGTPESLSADLAEHFNYVQLWLPPEGADSLVLLGSQSPFSLLSLANSLPEGSPGLKMLGMPDAMALAAHAYGERQSATDWGEGYRAQPSDRLGSRVFDYYQPHWHLLGLQPHGSSVDRAWNLESTEEGLSSAELARLNIYRETVELFLSNLVEEASGNPAASHLLSQQLDRRDDPLAQRKLSELISQHLELAKKRIEQAYATGEPQAWTDAHALAESAHRRAPGQAEPLILLGEILIAQKQLNSAQAKYEKVLELDPDNKIAHWGMARVARERHDTTEVESRLRQAIRLHPRDWTTWQQLGIFLLEQAYAEEAAEALSRAGALSDGKHPRPYSGLAQAQLELGKADQALATANRAIHLGGGAYALYLRGRAYMELEQLDRAEADFRGAILADPELIEARGGLGLIRAQQGDYAAAAEAFRGVLRVDPNHAAARENLRQAEERLRGDVPLEAP